MFTLVTSTLLVKSMFQYSWLPDVFSSVHFYEIPLEMFFCDLRLSAFAASTALIRGIPCLCMVPRSPSSYSYCLLERHNYRMPTSEVRLRYCSISFRGSTHAERCYVLLGLSHDPADSERAARTASLDDNSGSRDTGSDCTTKASTRCHRLRISWWGSR